MNSLDLSQTSEMALRRRLGIPDDAERVLVLAESSHWDPNWLFTAQEYYDRFVDHNLDLAIEALQHEPRRVYSVECMFFLRMYWERRPEQQALVRSLINQGRMRLTHSAVTTADTLLPSAEAILRDCLIGQEWLRANGMTPEPTLAYFTDSFGCTSSLPSLLRAAGFDRTAITRIDGMYFMGCDFESSKNFPRPGSTAKRLLHNEKTLDFVWRDRNGAQVLCHWNAFNYGQGDMLTYRGLSRVYVFHVAMYDPSERLVTKRLNQFIAQLDPLRRTPYMFCPIGMDFVEPIPGLLAHLDHYNRVHYPSTGVWVVNAGLDDYLELVDKHRDALPVLTIDPNPYWTGFYTARPVLKKRCHALVDRLLLAEQLALLPENAGAETAIAQELDAAWWDAATSNHHDFITGTSPDRVVEEEQLVWLERSSQAADAVIERLSPRAPAQSVSVDASNLPQWSERDGKIEVQTAHYAVELDRRAGGCITRAWRPETGAPLLTGLSNDLVSYRDSGGLWRMGCEFRGGTFKQSCKSSDQPTSLVIREERDGLHIACDTVLDGQSIHRSVHFQNDSPIIGCRVEGQAAIDRTVTVRFASGLAVEQLTMGEPGGIVVRPRQRIYNPTFWPVQHFVHFQERASGRGIAFYQAMPGAVSCRPDGEIELVALRNATRERAFGFLKLPANPAAGHEREAYAFDYGIQFTPAGDWQANQLALTAHRGFDGALSAAHRAQLRRVTGMLVELDRADVVVMAVKTASRGEGLIVRVAQWRPNRQVVCLSLRGRTVRSAFRCDARERDIEPLSVKDGIVELPMGQAIVSVRLIV